MEEPLFSEFPKVSYKTWEEQIIKDLKGKDYTDCLLGKNFDGIQIQPFYNVESNSEKPTMFSRDTESFEGANTWAVCEIINEKNEVESNKRALSVLQRGANSLAFTLAEPNIETLLQDVHLDFVDVHLANGSLRVLNDLKNLAANKDYVVTGSARHDFKSKELKEAIDLADSIPGNLKVTIFEESDYESESSIVRIGAIFSEIHRTWECMLLQGVEINTLVSQVLISLDLNENYFLQIAKIRAVRMLWGNLCGGYGIENADRLLYIHCNGSVQSDGDANKNMLRSTTQGMAAIIGGCNNLALRPHSRENPAFTHRIARNIQLILKEEAYFDTVLDPAKGSYYIEKLTHEFASMAWEVFKTANTELSNSASE